MIMERWDFANIQCFRTQDTRQFDIIEIHDPKLTPKPCVHGCMADQPRHSVIPLLLNQRKAPKIFGQKLVLWASLSSILKRKQAIAHNLSLPNDVFTLIIAKWADRNQLYDAHCLLHKKRNFFNFAPSLQHAWLILHTRQFTLFIRSVNASNLDWIYLSLNLNIFVITLSDSDNQIASINSYLLRIELDLFWYVHKIKISVVASIFYCIYLLFRSNFDILS